MNSVLETSSEDIKFQMFPSCESLVYLASLPTRAREIFSERFRGPGLMAPFHVNYRGLVH